MADADEHSTTRQGTPQDNQSGHHTRRDFLRYSLAGQGRSPLAGPTFLDATTGGPGLDEFGLGCSLGYPRVCRRRVNHPEPGHQQAYTAFGQKYPKIHSMSQNIRGSRRHSTRTSRLDERRCRDRPHQPERSVRCRLGAKSVDHPLSEFAELQPALHSVDPGSLRVAAYEGDPYVLPLAATAGSPSRCSGTTETSRKLWDCRGTQDTC